MDEEEDIVQPRMPRPRFLSHNADKSQLISLPDGREFIFHTLTQNEFKSFQKHLLENAHQIKKRLLDELRIIHTPQISGNFSSSDMQSTSNIMSENNANNITIAYPAMFASSINLEPPLADSELITRAFSSPQSNDNHGFFSMSNTLSLNQHWVSSPALTDHSQSKYKSPISQRKEKRKRQRRKNRKKKLLKKIEHDKRIAAQKMEGNHSESEAYAARIHLKNRHSTSLNIDGYYSDQAWKARQPINHTNSIDSYADNRRNSDTIASTTSIATRHYPIPGLNIESKVKQNEHIRNELTNIDIQMQIKSLSSSIQPKVSFFPIIDEKTAHKKNTMSIDSLSMATTHYPIPSLVSGPASHSIASMNENTAHLWKQAMKREHMHHRRISGSTVSNATTVATMNYPIPLLGYKMSLDVPAALPKSRMSVSQSYSHSNSSSNYPVPSGYPLKNRHSISKDTYTTSSTTLTGSVSLKAANMLVNSVPLSMLLSISLPESLVMQKKEIKNVKNKVAIKDTPILAAKKHVGFDIIQNIDFSNAIAEDEEDEEVEDELEVAFEEEKLDQPHPQSKRKSRLDMKSIQIATESRQNSMEMDDEILHNINVEQYGNKNEAGTENNVRTSVSLMELVMNQPSQFTTIANRHSPLPAAPLAAAMNWNAFNGRKERVNGVRFNDREYEASADTYDNSEYNEERSYSHSKTPQMIIQSSMEMSNRKYGKKDRDSQSTTLLSNNNMSESLYGKRRVVMIDDDEKAQSIIVVTDDNVNNNEQQSMSPLVLSSAQSLHKRFKTFGLQYLRSLDSGQGREFGGVD